VLQGSSHSCCIGYPAAFSLAAVGLAFGFLEFSSAVIEQTSSATYLSTVRIVSNDKARCCCRFHFTFMGAIWNDAACRRPARIHWPAVWPDTRRLSYAVIFVGAIWVPSPDVAASVIAMGVIALRS